MIVARKLVSFFSLTLLLTLSSVAHCQESDSALPSVEEVMEQHILAVGGYEILASISTMHISWECSKPGKVWVYESWKVLGKYFGHRTLNGNLDYEYGCLLAESHGDWAKLRGVAWRKRNGNIVSMHRGDELQSWLRETRVIAGHVRWRELYKSVRCVAVAEIDDVKCYHVVFVGHDDVETNRYFDVKTGYLRCKSGIEHQSSGLVMTRKYSDHQLFGEIVVAKTINSSSDRGDYLWKLKEFEYDEEIDMEPFVVPEEAQLAINKVNSQRKVTSKDVSK